MDGIVTLADAANGPRTLDAQFEAVNQVAMADLLIITKADLVAPCELERLRARLRGINSAARVVLGDHGRVAPGSLFNLTAMRESVTSDELSDWLGGSSSKPDPLTGLSGLAPKAAVAQPISDYIKQHWAEPWGDWRQELVFIGAGIDWPALKAKLDACLVPVVLAGGSEALPLDLPDPFPGWRRVEDAA